MSSGVVTPDARATEAAVEISQLGGSAADMAIAASAVLGVVQPHTCGLGGDVVAIVDSGGPTNPSVIHGIGRSGSNVDGNRLREQGLHQIPRTHPAAINVPGALDGWLRLHQLFGRLPMATILNRAISIAEQGFRIDPELSDELAATPWHSLIGRSDGADLDRPESDQELWKRPRLAKLLRLIASEGRLAFYGGEHALAIVAASEGLITTGDLLVDQAEIASPLSAAGHDLTVMVPGRPTQGSTLIRTFGIMEKLGGWSEQDEGLALHLLIESYRLAAEDAVVKALEGNPISVASDASSIGREWAGYRTPLTGVLGGTAYLAASDSDGLLVSVSQSNYYRMGSGRIATTAGVPLNNRGCGFNLEAGHVNELRPNSLPFHTLIPTILRHADGSRTAIGTRGGLLQTQIIMQLLFWSLRKGGYPGEYLDRPRLNIRPEAASSFVLAESTLPAELAIGLTNRGHRILMRASSERSWGPAFALTVNPKGGITTGVDPRSDGRAWSET